MSRLRELSDGLADAVAVARDSIVTVRARRRASTGVAWTDELVLTASHTVRREEGIVVVLPDGTERAAILVGRDPGADVALLRVADGGLKPPSWVTDPVRVGAIVLPVGRPSGHVAATLGIVSRVGGGWQTGLGTPIDAWIEVDGSLPAGFSGGPLVDADGHFVGINTAALTQRGAVLPYATLERVARNLRDHGTAVPGYLGVGFYPGTLPDDAARTAGQADALMAVSLEPGGPGEAAGVQVGDALVRLDGQAVTGLRHLMGLLATKGAGADVTLTLLRAGAMVDVSVKLGARPARKSRGWCG